MNTSLILGNIARSIKLNQDEESYFLSLLQPLKLRKKDYLVRAGDLCRLQSFVVSGCLKVSYLDADGLEHVVKFAPENWWALDLESFAVQTPAF